MMVCFSSHIQRLAAAVILFGCISLAWAGVPAYAAVQSSPLMDDTGGAQAVPPGGDTSGIGLPPFMQGEPGAAGKKDAGTGGVAPGADATMTGSSTASPAGLPPAREATVIAYLIELARRQDEPCPSGAKLPTPPSLVFSEPLSRVAAALLQGGDVLAAAEAQGVKLARWRLFSAGDSSAQTVVAGLRKDHCEALLEPYSAIGAARGPGGWRVLMAVLGDPAEADQSAVSAGAAAASPPAAVPPVSAYPAEAGAKPAQEISGGPVSGINSPRPRELFLLLNEHRKMGGICSGKTMAPSPPLIFNKALQADAEKTLGQNGPMEYSGLVDGYAGTLLTKIAGFSEGNAGPLLDTWLLTPDRCETLFSREFTHAGVAVRKGSWVLVLGGQGKGVPSPEPPGAVRGDAPGGQRGAGETP